MTNGRDKGVSYGFDESAVRRAVERHGLAADQVAADGDQGAADADQTASDSDQTASERDESDASRDQRSADRDQASADEQQLEARDGARAAGYEATRAARAASRIGRLVTHADRAGTAESRLVVARTRDRNAAARDDTTQRREARAVQLEEDIASSSAPIGEKLERLRELAARDRARAAANRRRASAERTASAAERSRLEAELHGAHLDKLTGAFHRDLGRYSLALEVDRARRADGRFVLAVVGVDGMGAINERAGRDAGDHVLRTLAATMRASLRSFDPIVRFGGDQLVCGVSGADVAEVDRRFGDIRASLHADTGAAISVGMAVLAGDEALDEVIARADVALLEAKRARPDPGA